MHSPATGVLDQGQYNAQSSSFNQSGDTDSHSGSPRSHSDRMRSLPNGNIPADNSQQMDSNLSEYYTATPLGPGFNRPGSSQSQISHFQDGPAEVSGMPYESLGHWQTTAPIAHQPVLFPSAGRTTAFPGVSTGGDLTNSYRAAQPANSQERRTTPSEPSRGEDIRTRMKAPSFTGCKYESGMAFSRRRMPYSIGGEQLERAKTVPKKFLSALEQERLNADMQHLYQQILPSTDSENRRKSFVARLHTILDQRWPESQIQVHVFGSSGNFLCTSDSDVDICITTTFKALERTCLLAAALAEHGMERVVCVPHAKVPIVKFWDPKFQVACDMNINNTLALQNTRMIKTFVEIDERVRPLAMIVKHWTKKRVLNDAALGGTLSSYTWICMILNFLQTRNPPILPSLHRQANTSFDDDLAHWRGFGQSNKENLAELLFHFFRRYAHDIDYEKSVVSVRQAQLLSKEGKRWHLMQNNRLCVEEPFNVERNLGNTADDISFRGLHLELRRAFDLISSAELMTCLEQYEFPTPSDEQILTRTRSQSQSTRGNRPATRSVRLDTQTRSRRASSAAATHDYLAQSRRHDHGQSNLMRAQYEQLRLHRRLFDEMQTLQRQEYELRVKQAQNQMQAELSLQYQLDAERQNARHKAPHLRTSAHNAHTQPPSPSLRAAQPDLRRETHRSLGINGSLRSHSQPARVMPPVILNQQQLLNLQSLRRYHQMQQEQARLTVNARYDEPKGYAGYWVPEDFSDSHSPTRDRSISLRESAQWQPHGLAQSISAMTMGSPHGNWLMPGSSRPHGPGTHEGVDMEVSPLDLSYPAMDASAENLQGRHSEDVRYQHYNAVFSSGDIQCYQDPVRDGLAYDIGRQNNPEWTPVAVSSDALTGGGRTKMAVQSDPQLTPLLQQRTISAMANSEVTAKQQSSVPSIALLSPVREVRTPSPVGRARPETPQARSHIIEKSIIGKMDLRIPSFGDLKAKRQALAKSPSNFENGISASPSITSSPRGNASLEVPQNTPASITSPARSVEVGAKPASNGWQHAPSRKSRKSRPSADLGQEDGTVSGEGEAMPVDLTKRKGG